jgi:predicted nucleic-acid-binding Zn-ribbon protein
MADTAYNCVKCGSETVKGFIADKGDLVTIYHTNWYDGEPVNVSLLGIKGDNLKVDRTQQLAVRGLRCKRCGYLELYAV